MTGKADLGCEKDHPMGTGGGRIRTFGQKSKTKVRI